MTMVENTFGEFGKGVKAVQFSLVTHQHLIDAIQIEQHVNHPGKVHHVAIERLVTKIARFLVSFSRVCQKKS